MIKALYTAASGMIAQTLKQDVIANNIANVQTPGFKRGRVISASFQQTLDKTTAMLDQSSSNSQNQAAGVCVVAVADTTDGALRTTDSPLQFAIQGPGAFQVGSGSNIRDTRNGSFIINKDGELATTNGELVQGSSGTIIMPQGQWSVTSDGSILNSKGQKVDQVKIIGSQAGKTSLTQGSLEDSNVSVVREMVDMITNMRSYEANQKVISSVDGTLDKLINEAGKV